MRQRELLTVRAAALARRVSPVLAVLSLLAPAWLPGGEGVAPGQSVAEVLKSGSAAASSAAPAVADAGSRLLYWTGGLGLTAAAVFVLRRRRARPGSPTGQEAVEVLGRAVLSHKHAVVVVRAAGKRIVVGLGGDSLSALAVIDEAREAGAGPPAQGFSSRLPESTALSATPGPRVIDPADLVPYRRQMERLRNILRSPPDGSRMPREEG
jgi:flagellar biogenesis protein FliO